MKETRSSKLTFLCGSLLTIGGIGWFLAIWANQKVPQTNPFQVMLAADDSWGKMVPLAALLIIAGCSLILGLFVMHLKSKTRAVRAANFSYAMPYDAALLWLLGGNFYYYAIVQQGMLIPATTRYERFARIQSFGFLLMALALALFLAAVYLKAKYQLFNANVTLISAAVLLLVGWIIWGYRGNAAHEQAMVHRYGVFMLGAGGLMLAIGVMFLVLQKQQQRYRQNLQTAQQLIAEAAVKK